MTRIRTVKDAKDFLAGRIAAEAEREGTPLSKIERKMLYFSETDWTLPDIRTVNAEFEGNYDEEEYEKKIAGFVRSIEVRNHAEDPQAESDWDEAVLKLSEGDHYLSLLISMAQEAQPSGHGFLPTFNTPAVSPPHDRLKLWVTAFVLVTVLLAAFALSTWISGR